MYYVYYLFDETFTVLLYIGRSDKPRARQTYFERTRGIKTTMGFCQRHKTFEAACAAELIAIAKHWPPHNKRLASSPSSHGQSINKGRRMSDETKAKISAASKGHPVSEHVRQIVSRTHKGKIVSAETRAKQSAAKIGNKNRLGTGAIFRAC